MTDPAQTASHTPPPSRRPRSRVKRRALIFRLLLLLLPAAVALFYWMAPQQSRQLLSEASTRAKKQLYRLADSLPEAPARKTAQPDQAVTAQQSPVPAAAAPAESLDTPAPAEAPQQTAAVTRLNSYYNELDHAPWMQQFHLEEKSSVHFSRLIQKLLDNPPIVSQETDDLYTLLKNTAHFFRILGAGNIKLLKGILHHDSTRLEELLHDFYLLTEHPDQLKQAWGITLKKENLRDYAAFLLGTMGGRLYLFRRNADSRMVVSWYAIKIVDQANKSGSNPWGLDLRPFINRLSDEMEHGGDRLRYRDEYLDGLQQLKERYEHHPDGSAE